MASPILDGLVTLAGPMLGRVAGQLGESPQSVSTGMKSGIAAILAGLLARAGDSGAMNQVAQAATSIDSAAVLSDPGTVLATPASATAPAGGVLSVLFGGRTGGIADAIAQASGMKSSSAASLLSMAVPLVLAFLKRQTGGTLSGGALANTLMSQRDAIMADAPAGLGSLLGLGGAGAAAAGMAGAAAGAASRAAAGARMDSAQGSAQIAAASMQSSGRNWLWPVLGVVGLALIVWLVLGRNRGTQTAATADTTASAMTGALDSTGRKMGAAADSAAGAIGGAVANLGAFVKRSLPGGVELNVPENGVESHLLSFITDANRRVSDTVWFNFDRLLFETGSSNLSPTSKEQVDNIAAILKAYPAVNIKLGGYTDNVGNAAANKKLSGDRANTVKAALVERGIAAGRLAAEGYGDAHPVADNSTPEGREQNRRIAIRVTKK